MRTNEKEKHFCSSTVLQTYYIITQCIGHSVPHNSHYASLSSLYSTQSCIACVQFVDKLSIPMNRLPEVINTVITCGLGQYRHVQSCPITQRFPSAHARLPSRSDRCDQSVQKLTRREFSISPLLYWLENWVDCGWQKWDQTLQSILQHRKQLSLSFTGYNTELPCLKALEQSKRWSTEVPHIKAKKTFFHFFSPN